jgi:hypothetical protein
MLIGLCEFCDAVNGVCANTGQNCSICEETGGLKGWRLWHVCVALRRWVVIIVGALAFWDSRERGAYICFVFKIFYIVYSRQILQKPP